MRNTTLILLISMLLAGSGAAKDKSIGWLQGTYVTMTAVRDGTFTDAIHCHAGLVAMTCAGGAGFNRVGVYRVQVPGGMWILETERQIMDTWSRKYMGDPVHLRGEKANPMDALQSGDRVLFRVEYHRKIGGTDIDVYIPYATDTSKEVKFIGRFVPDVLPSPAAPLATDNVKAMCESGRLSAELQKQFCTE